MISDYLQVNCLQVRPAIIKILADRPHVFYILSVAAGLNDQIINDQCFTTTCLVFHTLSWCLKDVPIFVVFHSHECAESVWENCLIEVLQHRFTGQYFYFHFWSIYLETAIRTDSETGFNNDFVPPNPVKEKLFWARLPNAKQNCRQVLWVWLHQPLKEISDRALHNRSALCQGHAARHPRRSCYIVIVWRSAFQRWLSPPPQLAADSLVEPRLCTLKIIKTIG